MENSLNALSVINCEANHQLTLSTNGVITNSKGAGTFKITNAGLCVPVETLPTSDIAKLLQQQLNS